MAGSTPSLTPRRTALPADDSFAGLRVQPSCPNELKEPKPKAMFKNLLHLAT